MASVTHGNGRYENGPGDAAPSDSAPSDTAPSDTAPSDNGGHRPPGRPRSAVADAAILAAARELLAERGWDAMTLGDVAARAGVAKTTLYRRWPGKAELVVDAMAHLFDRLCPVDAGSVRADAEAVIKDLVALLSRPEAQAAFLALAAQSARDPELRAAVREKIIDRQRRLVHAGAARAAARGDGGLMADPELLFDVIAGTVVQRVLIEGEPMDEGYLGRFLDLLGAALRG